MARPVSLSAQAPRDPVNKPNDVIALRSLAQAAVDVELFTIPLYMTSLCSIVGNHEINDTNALYKGWIWPGAAPVAKPQSVNEEAYNILFSIFIEEMLHLQMAANMATAVGVAPSFTSFALQTPAHGWKCYGEHLSIIPNIIDLKDTFLEEPDDKELRVPVNIGPLDATRLALFLAIEQPDEQAKDSIRPEAKNKYFPAAPFDSWTPAQPLPMFGTIGHMYQCYYDYLNIVYSDGTSLWNEVFDPKAIQNDHFNAPNKPPQYGFKISLDLADPASAFDEMCNMMDAITDQGEGSTLDPAPAMKIEEGMLEAVLEEYRAIKPNLEQLYPSYDNLGQQQPESDDANARCGNDGQDHYERFEKLRDMLPGVETWDKSGKPGNWQASDFVAPGGPWENPHGLPSPDDLAKAWNDIYAGRDAAPAGKDYFDLLSKACVGAIAGTNMALEAYWKDSSVGFPGPAMGGTGERMATAWAAFGAPPNLGLAAPVLPKGQLGHACQAIDYNIKQGGAVNDCAAVETFHSCIGSNNCHAEGGCGFVNKVTGGGSCSGSSKEPVTGPQTYSGPGDNKCGTLGGCAVPISASQLYPPPPDKSDPGTMEVFDFVPVEGGGYSSKSLGTMPYSTGDKVDEVAYRAFKIAMKNRGTEVPETMPDPSTLRLVFPPST